jgi:hypothetical protein
MSQFFVGVTDSSLPPDVAESFVTDVGTATPAAHVLNIIGGQSASNTVAGIQFTGSGPTVTGVLTNRFSASTTTADATPTTVLSVTPTPNVAGVYTITATITGLKSAAPQSAVGYNIFGVVRTDTVNCFLVGTPDKIVNEDNGTGGTTNMTSCDANISVSGNNIIFVVTGIAGLSIDWNMLATYTEAN